MGFAFGENRLEERCCMPKYYFSDRQAKTKAYRKGIQTECLDLSLHLCSYLEDLKRIYLNFTIQSKLLQSDLLKWEEKLSVLMPLTLPVFLFKHSYYVELFEPISFQ